MKARHLPKMVFSSFFLAALFTYNIQAEETFEEEINQAINALNQSEIDEILTDDPDAEQINDNTVSWDEGDPILELPTLAPDEEEDLEGEALENEAMFEGCPEGWYCFYDHKRYKGKKLQFKSCGPWKKGKKYHFSRYGFAGKTSSWVINRPKKKVNIYVYSKNNKLLWVQKGGKAKSWWVGKHKDNKAWYFTCYDDRTSTAPSNQPNVSGNEPNINGTDNQPNVNGTN